MSAPTVVGASPRRSPPRWPGRRTWPVWPLLLACAAYRLWYLTRPQAILDGDEAMTGLMVRRILAGHPYAFLADQHYNGAIEQYPQALVWAVLPQTPFTLRLPEVGLAVLACWLVFRVGREMLGDRRAWLAAALFAVGPFFLIWKGVRSHGAYPTAQILGLLGIWAALRLRAGPTADPATNPGARRTGWLAAAFGLVAGAAGWSAWTAGYLLVPAAVWLAPQLRRRPGLVAPVLAGALVGYLPALAWALRHHELPLLLGSQPGTGPLDRLRLLFGPVLREFLGVGYFGAAPGWPAALQTLAVLGLAGAYLVACWRRRHGLAALVLLRADGARRPADLTLLVPPVVVLFYVLSKFAWWAGEPRYLFAAYPALALGLAALPPGRPPHDGRPPDHAPHRPPPGRRPHGRPIGRLAGPLVATALLLAVGGSSLVTVIRHGGDGDAGRDDCLLAAGGWLARHGITAAYSDYWTGMPLQLLAGDRYGLSVAPMNSGRAKFPALRYAADAAPPAYVVSRALDPMGQAEDQVAAMDRELAGHGVAATRTQVACVTVYTDLRPALRPWELGMGRTLPPGRR